VVLEDSAVLGACGRPAARVVAVATGGADSGAVGSATASGCGAVYGATRSVVDASGGADEAGGADESSGATTGDCSTAGVVGTGAGLAAVVVTAAGVAGGAGGDAAGLGGRKETGSR
jgi:hypothetical protein